MDARRPIHACVPQLSTLPTVLRIDSGLASGRSNQDCASIQEYLNAKRPVHTFAPQLNVLPTTLPVDTSLANGRR